MKYTISSKSHLHPIKQAALRSGFSTELLLGGAEKKMLKITAGKKFCLLNGNNIGFYPDTTRWFAVLTHSKIQSNYILQQLGYNTIRSIDITTLNYPSADDVSHTLVKNIHYPCLIKPESGLKGKGIEVITNDKQLQRIVRKLHSTKVNFMLQEIVMQIEYRILVINNKVMFMHSKEFPSIVGDGQSTAEQLFKQISKDKDLAFFTQNLHQHKLNNKSILTKGFKIPYHITRKGSHDFVADHTNIPSGVRKWALTLAKKLNTGAVGIDVFIEGAFSDLRSYKIIEINANPGYMYIKEKYKRADIVTKIGEEIINSYFK